MRVEAWLIAVAGGLSLSPDCRWNRDLRHEGGGGESLNRGCGGIGLPACQWFFTGRRAATSTADVPLLLQWIAVGGRKSAFGMPLEVRGNCWHACHFFQLAGGNGSVDAVVIFLSYCGCVGLVSLGNGGRETRV